MEIVSCPKCGRPRAQGHRCPSCGDPAAVPGDATHASGGEWVPWTGAGDRYNEWQETGRSAVSQRPVTMKPPRKMGWWARRSFGQIAFMALVALAAIAAVVVLLTTAGGTVAENVERDSAVVDQGEDLAAQSLLRNAMTALDSAFVESMDFTAVTRADLQAIEPAIDWVGPSGAGVCAYPPDSAKAAKNVVGWAGTSATSYEIGTWSESGAGFGVKVDRVGGGRTYYKDGAVAAW